MDEFLVWILVIVVGCTAIWAVSAYRSKKRARRGGCIICGQDLGRKPDARAAKNYLLDGPGLVGYRTRLFGTHAGPSVTMDYYKKIRKVMCPLCAWKTVRNWYVRYVAYVAFLALLLAGMVCVMILDMLRGKFQAPMLLGIGIIALGICTIVSKAKQARQTLSNISKGPSDNIGHAPREASASNHAPEPRT
jgi:hypothetical protein